MLKNIDVRFSALITGTFQNVFEPLLHPLEMLFFLLPTTIVCQICGTLPNLVGELCTL